MINAIRRPLTSSIDDEGRGRRARGEDQTKGETGRAAAIEACHSRLDAGVVRAYVQQGRP